MDTLLQRDTDTATAVLQFARARRVDADEAERDVLVAAADWAAFHHADGLPDRPSAATMYADREVELAGESAPGMREFAIAEFAAALGMSTDSGRRLLGDAIELRYRLPGVWARVTAPGIEPPVAAWKARVVAQRTKQWSPEVAAYVDSRVAAVVHKIGPIQLGRLVEEATAIFDVDNAVEVAEVERYVRITPDSATGGPGGLTATATVEGVLALDDALALEQAVATRAHDLIREHPTLPRDERRAMALGQLADAVAPDTADATAHRERHLQLYVHLGEPDLAQAHLARAERVGLVTEETVASWCLTSRVTITPVLDLNAEHERVGYVPSATMREQVALIDQTCAFPWCNRSARQADLDHIVAYAYAAYAADTQTDTQSPAGGRTATSNLAALCRGHHRLKTHSGWSYARVRAGTYDWCSPRGDRYRRDRDGTRALS